MEETLSEGERSFITFLYFYHLIKGNHSADSNEKAEIIVFDDPVSSLDSGILFIVVQLIMEIIENEKIHLKQFFILTHNPHFYHDIAEGCGHIKGCKKNISFYTIRKKGDISRIDFNKENNIKNAYENLWNELRLLKKEGANELIIGNVMRRIIDYYFNFLGGEKPRFVAEKFTGTDRIIANSFLRQNNSDSHAVTDIPIGQSSDDYFRVFTKFFQLAGQEQHYKMMMKADGSVLI